MSVLRTVRYQPTTADRLIYRAWWASVMSMILSTAILALLFTHRSLFDVIGGRFLDALIHVGSACGFAIAALWLCRYRSDLLDE